MRTHPHFKLKVNGVRRGRSPKKRWIVALERQEKIDRCFFFTDDVSTELKNLLMFD